MIVRHVIDGGSILCLYGVGVAWIILAWMLRSVAKKEG